MSQGPFDRRPRRPTPYTGPRPFVHSPYHQQTYSEATPLSPDTTIPGVIKGVPQHVWMKPRGVGVTPPALSCHVDQSRWCVVWAFMETTGQYLDVPLLDASNRPVFPVDVPPMGVGRWAYASDDFVLESWTGATAWHDDRVGLRMDPKWTAGYPVTQWYVFLETSPTPHWVVRIIMAENHGGSPDVHTVRLDLIGLGAGPCDTSLESESYGVIGHYGWRLPWTQQAFGVVGSASVINERVFGVGSIDVANDIVTTNYSSLFLTTGANQGLSTGTALFGSELPAVFVLAESTATLKATASRTTWLPTSFGHSMTPGVYPNATFPEQTHTTHVQYDSVSGKVYVGIHNFGDPGGFDRTFYIYSIGKAA